MSRTYFTDRDLGKQFSEILSASGLQVERHHDHFAPDATDQEWLSKIGKLGWIAITHDRRIRYKPNELEAVVRNDVVLLVVVGAAPFAELANAFVATAPRIEAFLERHRPPLIAKVYRPSPGDGARGTASGDVKLWYPREE